MVELVNKNPYLQNSRDYSDYIWTLYLLIRDRNNASFDVAKGKLIQSFFIFSSELEFVLVTRLDVRFLPMLWNFYLSVAIIMPFAGCV